MIVIPLQLFTHLVDIQADDGLPGGDRLDTGLLPQVPHLEQDSTMQFIVFL